MKTAPMGGSVRYRWPSCEAARTRWRAAAAGANPEQARQVSYRACHELLARESDAATVRELYAARPIGI